MIEIPTKARVLLSIAGMSLLLATIGGAVGSHALGNLEQRALQSFDTAVQFLFFHGLALIAITLVALRGIGGPWLWRSAWLMVLGMLLFCGSIFLRTFGAPAGIVALAPYGGVILMVGWLVFAVSVWRRS